ncbi:Immunoglobulin I-set domain protein [Aphelenchoides besseyi]|nr:Immunoglobulin I-set domain protein [Aphelenchoides besseyi]
MGKQNEASDYAKLIILTVFYFHQLLVIGAPAQLSGSSNNFVDVVHNPKCPLLLDTPGVNFVKQPRILVSRRSHEFACQHVAECVITTTPPETNVYWYANSELVDVATQQDFTIHPLDGNSFVQNPIMGGSETTYRICIDEFMKPNKLNTFKCRIESACDHSLAKESQVMTVRVNENWELENNSAMAQKAPLITMITSTRMEIAGNLLKFFCRASGNPKPKISWKVIDDEIESVYHSLKNYPYIYKMNDGSVVIDSSKTDLASISLECRAQNEFGIDRATSTMLLLAREE